MATIGYEMICPQCGFPEAQAEERFSSYVRAFCGLCGWSYAVDFPGPEQQSASPPRTTPGAGAYEVRAPDGCGEIGAFTDEADRARFIEQVRSAEPGTLSVASYTEPGEDGVWRRVYLIGTPQPGDHLDSTGTHPVPWPEEPGREGGYGMLYTIDLDPSAPEDPDEWPF